MLVDQYREFIGGGTERCFTIIAKMIVKLGFDVSFITYGIGGKPTKNIDNIRIITVYERDDAPHLIPPIKAFYLWRALAKANADIYIGTAGLAGIISLFCRLKRRKNILFIASDLVVMKKPIVRDDKLNLANKFGIKLADIITDQSETQKEMLSQNFKRQSTVIKNPFILPDREMHPKHSPPITLWVAGIRPVKQAELFLDLAKAVPEAKFQMIGGPLFDEDKYFASIRTAAQGIPNMDFLGPIPRHKIDYYFAKASILVNTSIIEGFPNTFLEAWAAHTPVVTLNADPDEIICRYRLGFHSKDFDRMVEDVQTLLKNQGLRDEMGRNGRRYVEQEHNAEKIVGQYVKLFQHSDKKI